MTEYRREKELEDKRAVAGGITLNTKTEEIQEPKPQIPAEDPMQTLMKLKAYLDNDLISAEDYETKKKEILARM